MYVYCNVYHLKRNFFTDSIEIFFDIGNNNITYFIILIKQIDKWYDFERNSHIFLFFVKWLIMTLNLDSNIFAICFTYQLSKYNIMHFQISNSG